MKLGELFKNPRESLRESDSSPQCEVFFVPVIYLLLLNLRLSLAAFSRDVDIESPLFRSLENFNGLYVAYLRKQISEGVSGGLCEKSSTNDSVDNRCPFGRGGLLFGISCPE